MISVINQHSPDQLAWAKSQDRRQIYVGRGSPWGNPYTHLPLSSTLAQWKVRTREESIARYETWLRSQDHLMARLPSLDGAILVCHCHPQTCHGDVIARLAREVLNG